MIDLVAKVYENDSTWIEMAGIIEEIKISSGIRQGCTASTIFFKLVTYEIIRRLEEEGDDFIIDEISMNSIFFADDSILLAKTLEAARRNLKIVAEVSRAFGLEINESKSKILIFRKGRQKEEDRVKEVEGIEVVESVRYLGIEISDGRDIFKKHKEEIIKKAEAMANLTFWTIGTSCNKVLMGKVFWKKHSTTNSSWGDWG